MAHSHLPRRGDDSLLRSRKTEAEKQASDDAAFTWFSPPHESEERFRFLVTRESGPDLSILPTDEARFKKGLRAWRWESKETEEHEVYMVVKTRHNRIDLRRLSEREE